MTGSVQAAVVGASGFVGSAVVAALHRRGVIVREVRAPRLQVERVGSADDLRRDFSGEVEQLGEAFRGCDVVINCAGQPDAGSRDQAALNGANAVLPGLLGAAANVAGCSRYVHVSSAVVQGRAPLLDDSNVVDPFSAYSRSKIDGERLARELGPRGTVLYRPPSVHAASRKVSRLTARIAASPLATVAAPGSQGSPQAHIDNVGDLVAFLATCAEQPPGVVIHPSEGFTSRSLMETLGGRQPTVLPRWLARTVVGVAELAGRKVPAVAANARRVEMLWFGQEQAPSWASSHGWTPVATLDDWRALGRELNERAKERKR